MLFIFFKHVFNLTLCYIYFSKLLYYIFLLKFYSTNNFLGLVYFFKNQFHNSNSQILPMSIFSILLLPDEVTYYFFSFFYDFYFFSYLFFSKLFFDYFVLLMYVYVIFFVSVFRFLIFEKFICIIFFFTFMSLIILIDFFIFFVVFFFINLLIHFLNMFFKVPIAGLVFLSKDLIAIEDEDLWICSNIFYLDFKLIESDNISISLKTHEIDVFFTLITLFFDKQKNSVAYLQYSTDLNLVKNTQDLRKFFRKRVKPKFDLNQELFKLRSQQQPVKANLGTNLFWFYKSFFKSLFLYSESSQLLKKKITLKAKRIKNRNFQLSRYKNSNMIDSNFIIFKQSFQFPN
jgi:hypothetical protein